MAFVRKVKAKGHVYYYVVENKRVNGKVYQKYLGPADSEVVTKYRENIGPVTPILAEEIRKAELRWSQEWILEAIKEAVLSNIRSLRYIISICQRYERDGFGPPRRERREQLLKEAIVATQGDNGHGGLAICTRFTGKSTYGNFVIGGYTRTLRSRPFRSLVLGLPAEEGLRWVGNVGTGFKRGFLPELYEHLQSIRTGESPFEPGTDMKKMEKHGSGVSWVRPILIAEVKYTEATQAGMIYQPMFKRLRPDLKPGCQGRGCQGRLGKGGINADSRQGQRSR